MRPVAPRTALPVLPAAVPAPVPSTLRFAAPPPDADEPAPPWPSAPARCDKEPVPATVPDTEPVVPASMGWTASAPPRARSPAACTPLRTVALPLPAASCPAARNCATRSAAESAAPRRPVAAWLAASVPLPAESADTAPDRALLTPPSPRLVPGASGCGRASRTRSVAWPAMPLAGRARSASRRPVPRTMLDASMPPIRPMPPPIMPPTEPPRPPPPSNWAWADAATPRDRAMAMCWTMFLAFMVFSLSVARVISLPIQGKRCRAAIYSTDAKIFWRCHRSMLDIPSAIRSISSADSIRRPSTAHCQPR